MRAYHTTKAPEPTLDSVLWRYGARLLAGRHSVERRPRGVRPGDGLGRGEGQVQVLVDDDEEAAPTDEEYSEEEDILDDGGGFDGWEDGGDDQDDDGGDNEPEY